MNEKTDKQLEALVSKTMKQSTLESPSFDFTAHVMSQVNVVTQSQSTVYQPLISKRVWAVLFGVVVALLAYILLFGQAQSTGWFSNINFSMLNTDKISNPFSGFQFYKTTVYAISLFALMLLIQIPILKNYFNKRMTY